MASKMLPKKSLKPSAPCDSSSQTTELQTKVKKLQAELEAERTKVKQLRREKNLESRQIREQEQNNARIALKDLKSKFTVAKQRELEIQKDSLNRKYETEVVKLRKQKDGEITKLRSNLRKCQNELTEAIHCLANSAQHHGLSGAARASSTFESERAKLLAEVQELSCSKRHLDDVVKTLTESERHKTHTIKTLEERLKCDVEKFKKEADIEAKRLLDELKSKDRQITQLEKDISVRDGQITKLRHEIEANMDQTKRNNELMRRFASRGLYKKADSLSSLESSSSDSGADLNGPPTENEHQLQQFQEQIRNLKEQNQQLTSQLLDMEDKQKPLHEKARKFLEKNMEQTALNRDLEDRIKVLNENNNTLKAEVDKTMKENRRLSQDLEKDKTDRALIKELESQVEELTSDLADQEDVILALQHACTEKDRRLELLSHRRRKQRNSRSQQKVVRFLLPDQVDLLAAGIKETYYGYDEDRASVDSEGSSRISLDATMDEDIFDEITREECEKNYQRLAREHLELERSYALLQNQAALSPTASLNPIKELGWTDDEKLNLEKTVQNLQSKLQSAEDKLELQSTQLKETLEQHEDLEFQLLELQEAHDKLLQESEETKSELSFHLEESEDSPSEHQGALESKNEELRKKIHKLQRSSNQDATTEERALLLQAKVLLDVSDKKIRELATNEETLNSKLRKLEEERVTLLSQSAGEPEQLVLEYEQIRNELHTVKQENENLKETNIILESQNQDLSYQIEDWAIINKMDTSDKPEGAERPVSDLLEEEIKALKYGELQLAEQNTRLSKELSRVRQELDTTKDELIAANLEISKARDLKEENVKLSEELSVVKDELKATQEKLSTASVERSIESRVTRLSLDDDLVEDNQRLRAEIFSLQEQLKVYEAQSPTLTDSTDITSPDHRIKVLEKEINDLKHHNDLLKEKLKEREKDVLKSREVVVAIETDLTDLEKENGELRDKIDDLETEDDNEVAALRVKVRALERSARMLQEQLETTGGDVSSSIDDVLEELEQEKDKVAELRKHMDRMAEDLVELEALKGQVAELENVRHDLKEKLNKLKHLQERLGKIQLKPDTQQELADSEPEIVTSEEVAAVRSKPISDESSEDERKDFNASLRAIQAENRSLQATIKELEKKLIEAEKGKEEHAEKLTSEKDRRIEILENELSKLQANEDTLNDTIEELREVENALRSQVSRNEDSASDSDKSDDRAETLQLDLTKLHDTNSSLLSQIAEMTETEQSLREQLSNTEDSFKSQIAQLELRLTEKDLGGSSDEESDKRSVDGSGDKKSDESKLGKLESRVQELAARESELMEQIYAMKLENQELQEHVELLQGESPRSSEGDSPRSREDKSRETIIEELKSNIKELEEEKSNLKDELLQAKLQSVETLKDSQELQIDAGQIKALQDQINELEKNEANLKKELKELEEKIEELETSASNLKEENIRLLGFEAKAKEHELCGNKLQDTVEKLQELEKKLDDMGELEKELADLRNQKTEFEKERETLVTASVVGPLGSARKSSESESDDNKDDETVKALTSKVHELESEIDRLYEFEVKSKDLERSENKLKNELDRLREFELSAEDKENTIEELKSEIERLKKYEAVYSTERAEVEVAFGDDGIIEVETEQVGTERVERELTDQHDEDKLHVAVEKEAVLATVNVGSLDRKRRSPKSSESDAEEVKELTMQVKELESQLDQIPELKAQLYKMKEHNSVLVENLTKMKLHIDEMEAEERELHEQLRKRKGLQAQLQEMEAQFAAQNDQLVAYHKAVETEKNKLREDRDELKKHLDLMEERRNDVEGERDELKASLVMAKEETNETIAKLEKFNESFEEMKTENTKLTAENEDLRSQLKDLNEIVTLSDELREQNTSLQNEFDEMKVTFKETVIEKENLEKSEKELKGNCEELQEKCQNLEDQVQSKADTEVKLFEKIEVLVESEGRLMEKLEEAEEEEDLLREEVDKLKEENEILKRKGGEVTDEGVKEKVEELEKKERNLTEQIRMLETKKEELEDKLENAKKSENEELVRLREKVDILLDTEEKLMDRLQEQEEIEIKLREKIGQLEDNDKELRVQLVTAKEKEEELRTRSSSKSSVDTDSESHKSQDQIEELENTEKVLKQRINELEKSEAVLSTQVRGLEKTLETLAKSETDLRDRLKESEQDQTILQLKYDELGKMEIALHTKVKDLEDQNRELMSAIKEQRKGSETHYHITQSLESKPRDFTSSSEEEMIKPESVLTIASARPSGRKSPEQLVTSSVASLEEQIAAASRDIRPEVAHLYDLSKDELVTRLHESEQMEEFHRDKIRELSDDLSQFRQAVEVVAGEQPDEPTRSKKSRPKSKLQYSDDYTEERDSGLESLQLSFTMLDSPEAILKQRISELEKMEQHQKQQIIELEKDREELHEIARHDKNHIHELSVQNREYELSEKNLKDQINRLEASETKLQLEADDLTDKLEELEEQIKSMKLAEKQLKAALVKTENNESELTVKLENAQGDVEHTQNKWKRKVSEIEGHKVNLANKVEELTLRVSDLEGSELTLKRKLKSATESNEENKEKVTQLEESESDALSRVQELEAINEALSQKLRKLEEEKASLLYELSDLETTHIDGHDTVYKLKSSQRQLLEDLAKREGAGALMQKKLKEYMQRENELEDELEKYQKLEKQWNEKREKMEAKIDALTAKVQELEALIASNETKVSFVNDLEKENGILHRNLAHQQKTIQQSDQEIHKLQDKIMQFEYSSANNTLATLPKVEVADLRAKAKLLEEAEEKITKLEKLEKHLRECIEKLREGKDAHGYELEIAEMKEKVNKYNQVVQAHELLKENHDHTKKELKALREQIQKGDVKLVGDTRPESTSKGILARLTHSFTLSEITPELKQALKQLEAEHPEAYDEFVRTLHPGAGSMAVLKPSQEIEARLKISDDDSSVAEEQVEPLRATSTSASQPSEGDDTKRQGTKHQVYGRVIDAETEETVWSAIEGPPSEPKGNREEDPLWSNIEGATEDVTLTMFLGKEDLIKKPKTASVLSTGSTGSSRAPPLPETIPPELSMRRLDSPGNDSSYYLPSAQESIMSADEASEIDEDELTGLRSQSRTPPRAKSVDRDSVISESLLSASPGKRMASSMDSIPDSGMGTLHQSEREILRERIMHLEKQLKSKEKELNLAQINQRELDAEATSQTMVELQDKIQRLQEDVKLKDVQLDSLRSASRDKGENDLSELESNINVLKLQLDEKENEITTKNNNIDSLMKKIKDWENNTITLKEDKESMEKTLKEAESKLDDHNDLEEKYSELQSDFIELQREYNQLEDRLTKTSDSEQTIEELEETVMKLRGQLSDLDRLQLERDQLEAKLGTIEEEFKTLKSENDDLGNENTVLHHKIDMLTRDVKALQTNSVEYNKIKSKYASMEKSKSHTESLITPLRAKVIRLSKTCKEKDNLIERLANEVRQADKKNVALLEADQMITNSASEEYNRPLTPLHVPSSDEDEIILGDMPPLVSASVLHSGTESYSSDVSGSDEKPKASRHQTEALIEQRIPDGTYMAPRIPNGSTHPAVVPMNNVTIDDLVVAPQQASLAPVHQLAEKETHTLPKEKKRSKADTTSIIRTAATTENYRAVKDYNPEQFSRSGHRRLELPLKEGDIVKVLGEIVSVGCRLVLQYMIKPGIFAQCSTDDKGYFEAELDGKVGLVPANYLQPVYPTRPHRPKSDNYGDRAPEQILSMHADLQRAHVPMHKVPYVSSAYDDNAEGLRSGSSSARSSTREGGSSITHPMFLGAPVMPIKRKPKHTRKPQTGGQPHGYITHPGHYNQVNGYPLQIATSLPSLPTTSAHATTTSVTSEAPQPASSRLGGPPGPPMGLHVQRVVGRHSLLLAWKAPLMDELARSNGVQVTGYRLQIDGRDKQDLPSPHLTKALIEHLNLRKAHHFTLQTVSANGGSSRPVHTNYEGPGKHRGEEEGDSAGDGDVSSIMSSSHNGTGDHDRRVFMAIYNYNPQIQSPKSDSSDELPLSAGDIITTYGPAKPDGFYHARVKGRKGLVPANFIEEIALFRSGSHRSLMSGSGAPVSHPVSGRPSSSGTKHTKLRS